MKTSKRILAALLAACTLFSLTACASRPAQTSTPAQTTRQPTQQEAPAQNADSNADVENPEAPAQTEKTDTTERHFFEYATKYPQRIPQIAGKLGCNTFEISKNGFQAFTNALINVTRNYQSMGGLMRQIGQKAIYYYNDVIIIMYDGKLQSAMIGNLKTFLNMK